MNAALELSGQMFQGIIFAAPIAIAIFLVHVRIDSARKLRKAQKVAK